MTKIEDDLRRLSAACLKLAYKFSKSRDIYNKATEEDKKKIDTWLHAFDFKSIFGWLELQRVKDIESLQLRQLRALARKLNIQYYTIYTKSELVGKIYERQDQLHRKRNP